MMPKIFTTLLLASLLGLSGCADKSMSDLERFVAKANEDKTAKIEPLPRIKPAPTFKYTASELVDPFSTANLIQDRPSKGDGPAPDPTRRKEPLEQFPLDALRMVGTLSNAEASWAIIRAPDGTVHRASKGNHLGQNYGKIVAIEDNKIDIVELIPGINGGWMQRDASLAIVGAKGNNNRK